MNEEEQEVGNSAIPVENADAQQEQPVDPQVVPNTEEAQAQVQAQAQDGQAQHEDSHEEAPKA